MQTTTTVHVTNETHAFGEIPTLPDGRRFMSLVIGEARCGATNISLLINDPAFLDRLSNEADRLCREFVGDVPAPSQEYLDGLGELQSREALR